MSCEISCLPIKSAITFVFFFLLDAPSFVTQGPAEQFVRIGGSASLVCGTGLDSNPQATITWTAPDGATIMDSRYDVEDGPNFVRLNFTNATVNDNGVWRCEVVVMSERHVFSEGQFILQNQTLIGSIIQNTQLTVIGKLRFIV
jgi:hypothetical protein